MKHGQRRVTLDLDDADPMDAVRGYYNLHAAGAVSVDVRVSSGGEGFHVRGWFDRDELDREGVDELRYGLGDHVARIELDASHDIKPDQMLFTRKPDGSEAGPWREDVNRAIEDFKQASSRYGIESWCR